MCLKTVKIEGESERKSEGKVKGKVKGKLRGNWRESEGESERESERENIILPRSFIDTVSVTAGDPPCKDDNARFTMVPLKALSHLVWIRYQCFKNLIIFNYGFSIKVVYAFLLQENMYKLSELNQQKRKYFFQYWSNKC